ncbi:hypothetical protein KC19_1G110300 [Ceratodon purpureus]|uniref:Uncharacterized protein n=1 Tax=Ceratodon purpureus TaxID=3225 RepID=A0A8T0J6N5_CERPU|nr:hypothetical protein KC19_1G110300 [Ceratodon purpureus]
MADEMVCTVLQARFNACWNILTRGHAGHGGVGRWRSEKTAVVAASDREHGPDAAVRKRWILNPWTVQSLRTRLAPY